MDTTLKNNTDLLHYKIPNYDIPIDFLPLNVAVYRYDGINFIFIDFNKMAEQTENIKKENILGKNICDVFPGVKEFGLYDVLLRVYQLGGHETFEKTFYEDDRISGWRKNDIIKLPNGDLMAIYEDLTEIKQLEEENRKQHFQLQESEKKFRNIFDNASDGIIIHDLNGKILEVNRVKCERLGYTREELLGQNLSLIDTPKYYDKIPEKLKELKRNGQLITEVKHVTKTGELIPVEIHAKLIEYMDQSAVLSIIRDIRERKAIEKALQNAEELYHAFFDLSPIGILLIDPKTGRATKFNRVAHEALGYTAEEFAQLSINDYEVNETHKETAAHIKMLQTGDAEVFETKHRSKNGKILDVSISVQMLEVQGKKYLFSMYYDTTEQKVIQSALEKSEKKYRDLVENAMIGIYRTDLSGAVYYVNSALISILSYDSVAEFMQNNSSLIYKIPIQREEFIRQLIKNNNIMNYEVELLDKYKRIVPVLLSASLDGTVISGMIVDMSEIKKSRQEIDKLSKIIEQTDDTVVVTDENGVINYVNPAFTLHTGYERDEVLGKTPRIFKSGKHEDQFYAKIWETILHGKVYRGTIINKKKNGRIYYENKTITPLKDSKNNIIGFFSTGKDVTKEKLIQNKIEQIASYDNLTKIYNRHKFEELFMIESERSIRSSQPLSLIMIDVDHFKIVNDTYGHDVGDGVLIHLAEVIQVNIRKTDIFARWGGEEFLVLSPGTDIKNVYLLAEKLRSAIEGSLFPIVKCITISLGISTFSEDDTFAEFFKRADMGLYQAKAGGRNRIGEYNNS